MAGVSAIINEYQKKRLELSNKMENFRVVNHTFRTQDAKSRPLALYHITQMGHHVFSYILFFTITVKSRVKMGKSAIVKGMA
jgi:hypothetical protein